MKNDFQKFQTDINEEDLYKQIKIKQFIKNNYNSFLDFDPTCYHENNGKGINYSQQYDQFLNQQIKDFSMCYNQQSQFWATFQNNQIDIYLQQNNQIIQNLTFENSEIIKIQFSNNQIVVLTNDNTVSIFQFSEYLNNEIESDNQFMLVKQIHVAQNYKNIIISPQENYLVLTNDDDEFIIYEILNNFNILKELKDFETGQIAFSSNDQQMAIVQEDSQIQFYNVANFMKMNRLQLSQQTINSIQYSNDQKYFQSSGDDGILRIYELKIDIELIHEISDSQCAITCSQFSNNSKYVASAGSNGFIYLYSEKYDFQMIKKINNGLKIQKILFSTNSHEIYCQGIDELIKCYIVKANFNKKQKITTQYIEILMISISLEYIAIVYGNNSLRIFNLIEIDNQQQYLELNHNQEQILSVQFQKQGNYLAIHTKNNHVFIYDINQVFKIKFKKKFNLKISKILFNDYSHQLLIAFESGILENYKLDSQFEKINSLDFHADQFQDIKFIYDQKAKSKNDINILCIFQNDVNYIIDQKLKIQTRIFYQQSKINTYSESDRVYSEGSQFMAVNMKTCIIFFQFCYDQYYEYQKIYQKQKSLFKYMIFSKCMKYFAACDHDGLIYLYSINDNFKLIKQLKTKKDIQLIKFFNKNQDLLLMCISIQEIVIYDIKNIQNQQFFEYFMVFEKIQSIIQNGSQSDFLNARDQQQIQQVVKFYAPFQINFIYFISYMEDSNIRADILQFLALNKIFIPFQGKDYLQFYYEYIYDPLDDETEIINEQKIQKSQQINLFNYENKQFLIQYFIALKDEYLSMSQKEFLSIFLRSVIKLQLDVKDLLDSQIFLLQQQDYRINTQKYYYFYSKSRVFEKAQQKKVKEYFKNSTQTGGTFKNCHIYQIKYKQDGIYDHNDLLKNDIFQLIQQNYVGAAQPIYKSFVLQHLVNNVWTNQIRRVYFYEGLIYLFIILLESFNYLEIMGQDIMLNFTDLPFDRYYVHLLNASTFIIMFFFISNEQLEICMEMDKEGSSFFVRYMKATLKHFNQPLNIIEIMAYSSSIIVSLLYWAEFNKEFHSENNIYALQVFMTISITFQGISVIKYLRISNRFSFLLQLIIKICLDMRYFLLIIMVILWIFYMAYYIIQFSGFSEQQQFQKYFLAKLMYNLLLADFNDQMKGNYQPQTEEQQQINPIYMDPNSIQGVIYEFYFVMATMILSVILLNMLISIMGETFDKFQDIKEQTQLHERLQIISEYMKKKSYILKLLGVKTDKTETDLFLNIVIASDYNNLTICEIDDEGLSSRKKLELLNKQSLKQQQQIDNISISINSFKTEYYDQFKYLKQMLINEKANDQQIQKKIAILELHDKINHSQIQEQEDYNKSQNSELKGQKIYSIAKTNMIQKKLFQHAKNTKAQSEKIINKNVQQENISSDIQQSKIENQSKINK